MTTVSPLRRQQILDALRNGTVPAGDLDVLAVGLDRFEAVTGEQLDSVTDGGAVFKAIRGEYGTGKTFFARWLEQRALARGMAVAYLQLDHKELQLHRPESVYRSITRHLRTDAFPPSAFRGVLDAWLFEVEGAAADASPDGDPSEAEIELMLDQRLGVVGQSAPDLPVALRAYRNAVNNDDTATADGLAAWLAGSDTIGAAIKRPAGIRHSVDRTTATGFLQALLTLLKGGGHPGLLVLIDEVETLQRRPQTRDQSLDALRQYIDDIDGGKYPGLYLAITGTPAFYDSRNGVPRLPPLAQRLATDFTTDERFDNPRATQIRLPGFNIERLEEVGIKVRNLYAADDSEAHRRVRELVDDTYIRDLAGSLAGNFGGQVSVVPRLFLKKLVAEVLDRVEQYPDFDPRRDYQLTIRSDELEDAERSAFTSPDDVEL